jgi:preprotein translocase subunit SecB
VLLAPVNFEALYQQRLAQQTAQQPQGTSGITVQ